MVETGIHTVLVCQNTTCTQQGSAKILTLLQAQAPASITVQRSGCLGQCGSGPMVLVLPEEIWYAHVSPQDARAIAAQHLKGGKPVAAKLYAKFHPQKQNAMGWWIVGGVLASLLALVMLSVFGGVVMGSFHQPL